MTIPLTPEALLFLANVSGGRDIEAARVIGEILHDIAIDDERAHSTMH